MREICLDTETTGLDPKDGHKIIEIACFELINRSKTGKFFHTYVNPRRVVPEEAFRIHGISTQFLEDKPGFEKIAAEFLDFIKDDQLVIHNAPFDLKFLNYELSIIGCEPLEAKRITDSLVIARNKFPGSQNSLDALCKRFNLDLSMRQKHGALIDTELLCDVYIELMGGAQGNFAFDSSRNSFAKSEIFRNDNSRNLNIENIKTNNRKILEKRDFAVSKEDLEIHKNFILKNFKDNFWNFSEN